MFSCILQHSVWKRSGSKEKISKGGDKYRKVRKGCGEAYDVNKHTIYIVPKSEIELRAHYALEPARGRSLQISGEVTFYRPNAPPVILQTVKGNHSNQSTD